MATLSRKKVSKSIKFFPFVVSSIQPLRSVRSIVNPFTAISASGEVKPWQSPADTMSRINLVFSYAFYGPAE